jgi:uncharacterized membrane protein
MTENFCANYVRQVGRELQLPQRKKRKLLDGLKLELEEQFPEGADQEVLISQVGQPAETAQSLWDSVSPEAQKRYQTTARRRVGCVIAALALLLAVTVGLLLYLDATQVTRAEISIIQDPVPIDYTNHFNEYHSS